MRAKVKSTGEIVDVYCDFKEMKYDFLDETGKGYMSNDLIIFDNEDYEQGWNDGYYEAISTNHDPDYWTKLEHQYAGMAVQGILSNPESELDFNEDETFPQALAGCAAKVAHALVEKLKVKEE